MYSTGCLCVPVIHIFMCNSLRGMNTLLGEACLPKVSTLKGKRV